MIFCVVGANAGRPQGILKPLLDPQGGEPLHRSADVTGVLCAAGLLLNSGDGRLQGDIAPAQLLTILL